MKFEDFFEEEVIREVEEIMQSKRLPRDNSMIARTSRLPEAKPVYRSPDDELDSDGDDGKLTTLKKLSYSDKINLDKIPDDIGDKIMPGEKEDRTSPNFELDPFPDTAAKEPSNKVLSGIKKVLTVLLYPVYGPAVYIVSKFFPTAFLAEMLKTLRFYGDTIIGDARRRRNVQRTLRKAVVAREKEMSDEMEEMIMSGEFDDDLDSLLASGLEDILPDTVRALSDHGGGAVNKQKWIKLKRVKEALKEWEKLNVQVKQGNMSKEEAESMIRDEFGSKAATDLGVKDIPASPQSEDPRQPGYTGRSKTEEELRAANLEKYGYSGKDLGGPDFGKSRGAGFRFPHRRAGGRQRQRQPACNGQPFSMNNHFPDCRPFFAVRH